MYELEGDIPFNRVHGTHAFECPGKDPRLNEVFNKAMINHKILQYAESLRCTKVLSMKSLVDVGGGLGITINIITTKYPNIMGVKHIREDVFENVPEGDAIVMKWMPHDWDDDHCLKLLNNCFKALPDSGKVIGVDSLLTVKPNTIARVKNTFQIDLNIITQNPGEKERSEQAFLALANVAGSRGISIECFVCNRWVMEFHK